MLWFDINGYWSGSGDLASRDVRIFCRNIRQQPRVGVNWIARLQCIRDRLQTFCYNPHKTRPSLRIPEHKSQLRWISSLRNSKVLTDVWVIVIYYNKKICSLNTLYPISFTRGYALTTPLAPWRYGQIISHVVVVVPDMFEIPRKVFSPLYLTSVWGLRIFNFYAIKDHN